MITNQKYLVEISKTLTYYNLETTLEDEDPLSEEHYIHSIDDKVGITHPNKISPSYISIDLTHLTLPKNYYHKFNLDEGINKKIYIRWEYLKSFTDFPYFYE